jgi:hypothetical protein
MKIEWHDTFSCATTRMGEAVRKKESTATLKTFGVTNISFAEKGIKVKY